MASPSTSTEHQVLPTLALQDFSLSLRTPQGSVTALRDINFEIAPGEAVGLVGESGSGKSLTILSILGLLPANVDSVSGKIMFRGQDRLKFSQRELVDWRRNSVGLMMQSSATALDPCYTVANQVSEYVSLAPGAELTKRSKSLRTVELLESVGIRDPERWKHEYPHKLSGGMKQRVVGACALASGPELLLADEPTTALDPTVQLKYLDLIASLRATHGFSLLFISHDFGVVARVCDRIAVMYGGRIVEEGPTDSLIHSPSHPYTRALVACIPRIDLDTTRLSTIEGNPPQLGDLPNGCPFAPRCDLATELCFEQFPPWAQTASGSQAACWHLDEIPKDHDDTPR